MHAVNQSQNFSKYTKATINYYTIYIYMRIHINTEFLMKCHTVMKNLYL